MSLKQQTIRGVKWTTLSTVIVAIVALLRLSILARILEKSDFGLLALVMFVLGFSNLFMDMGLTSAILHKQNISEKEYSSLYWLNVFFSLFLFLVLLIIAPLVVSFYSEPELGILIPIMASSLIISSLGRQYKTVLQKHLEFKQISINESLSSVLSLVIAVCLALKGYGVYSLVYSTLFQYLVSNILFFINGFKKAPIKIHFSYSETKPFLKIGIYQVGGQVINYFNKDIDILILGKVFGSELLGGYSLAKQLVYRPLQIINPIFTRVASPVLAQFQYDFSLLKKHYLKLVSTISTINLPIYLFTIIFAPFIIKIVYGKEYLDMVLLTRILSVYMFFRAIGNPIGSLITATGTTQLELNWQIITLIVTPIFVIVGAFFSVTGAAIMITLSMIVLFIPSWKYMVKKVIDVSLKEYIKAIFTFEKINLKK